MEEKLLDQDDFLKILRSKYEVEDIEIKGAKWEPLSEDIEEFLGDHFILTLTFTLKDQQVCDSFFIKTMTKKTEIQGEMTTAFNVYKKEIFMYDILQKKFSKLGYDVDFAPWCYLCKDGRTLVMDNVKNMDYKLIERNRLFDLDHCKAALKSMATYHGNFISYEEIKSIQTGREFRVIVGNEDIFRENFFSLEDKTGLGFQFNNNTTKCFLKIIDLLPETESWKKSFELKLKSFDPAQEFNKELPCRKTCGHGDLWSNNMLFKYSNNIPTHCKLVDFQILRYHYPAFDPLLILYSNTDKSFREKHLQDLLNFYYDQLNIVIQKNGFDLEKIMTRSTFFKSVDHLKKVALFQGATVRTIVLFPKEALNDAVNSGGEGFKSIVFEDRAELVYKAIQKDENRKIIFEDAYELYDHL